MPTLGAAAMAVNVYSSRSPLQCEGESKKVRIHLEPVTWMGIL